MNSSNEMAAMLQVRGFTHFLTVTCRQQPLSIQAARRVAENIYSYTLKGGNYFWVAEKFNQKRGHSESFHIHGLICQSESQIPGLWAELFERYGRARIEPIRSPDAVAAYCAKYITKELSDYDFVFVPVNHQLSCL